LQRPHRRGADPAGASRGEVPADGRGGAAAPLAAHLRRGRRDRALHRHKDRGHAARRRRAHLGDADMRREIFVAVRMTLVTLVLTGLVYPLALTAAAQVLL